MQRKNHPIPDLAKSASDAAFRDAVWCPQWYGLDDGRLEEWLMDQVGLTPLPSKDRLRILGELIPVVQGLRDGLSSGRSAADVLSEQVPTGSRDWSWFEVSGVFNVWRHGRNGWALQLRRNESGEWEWQAGHSLQPFVACVAGVLRKGQTRKIPCGQMAATLAPVCLKHVHGAHLQPLAKEGLVEAKVRTGADDGLVESLAGTSENDDEA